MDLEPIHPTLNLIIIHIIQPRHGEAIAQSILDDKLKLDPNKTGKWVQDHPDQATNKDPCHLTIAYQFRKSGARAFRSV